MAKSYYPRPRPPKAPASLRDARLIVVAPILISLLALIFGQGWARDWLQRRATGASPATQPSVSPAPKIDRAAIQAKWDSATSDWRGRVEKEFNGRESDWKSRRCVSSADGMVKSDDSSTDWNKASKVMLPSGHSAGAIKICGIKNDDHWLNAIQLFDERGASVGRVGDQTDREIHEQFSLVEGEYITGITFRTGRFVDWLIVHTNRRDLPRVGEDGGDTTHTSQAGPGMKVIGFAITGGTELRRIAIIYEPLAPTPTREEVIRDIPAPPQPAELKAN